VRYRELAVTGALAPHVERFWSLEGISHDPQAIFPDGRMELVVHYGDRYARLGRGGAAELQPRAILAGQIEKTLWVRAGGRVGVVGASFRPGGARAFFRFPMEELRGYVGGLEDVVRGAFLDERVAEALDFPARAAVLERFLLGLLGEVSPLDPSLGARQLRRRHLDLVGLSPKAFQRIRRFQRALVLVEQSPLADAALEAGYFDQAHLNRDFRDLADMTPGQYLRYRRGLEPCPLFPIVPTPPSDILAP
jgi:hypothetical protein